MVIEPGPEPADAGPRSEPAAVRPRASAAERIVALIEVILCSDYPTQFALGATLVAFGIHPRGADGRLDFTYIVTLSLVDTAVLIGLIAFFLAAHRESLSELLFGGKPVRHELAAGLPMTLLSLVLAGAVLGGIQQFAPQLHSAAGNPLKDLVRTPGEIAIFAVVIVVAGGVREEIQRAFLLRRFERWLGGGAVGVVMASMAFGAGHLLQGVDAAIATGILGAFWGVVYLRRRSVVAPVVSHSGFNLLELAQFLTIGR